MEVIDFEAFAARNGASRQGFGDAGMHRRGERHSDATWGRALRVQFAKDERLMARRAELRLEYDSLVKRGEIRAPSYRERTIEAAQGHPDLQSTQAAIRLCARRGWL